MKKIDKLKKLYPHVDPLFLQILDAYILADSSNTNYCFNQTREIANRVFPDAEEGYHATALTVNAVLIGDVEDVSLDEPEEPTLVTIRLTPNYGS